MLEIADDDNISQGAYQMKLDESVDRRKRTRVRLQNNAAVAAKAMREPLVYAWMLQKRLDSMGFSGEGGARKVLANWREVEFGLLWDAKERKKVMGQIEGDTDTWLAGKGPENAYVMGSLGEEAKFVGEMDVRTWMPWRKWSKSQSKWVYAAEEAHAKEVGQ